MKKNLSSVLSLLVVVLLTMTSCDSNEQSENDQNNTLKTSTEIRSTLSHNDFLNVQKSIISRFYGAHTRAEEVLSETEAQQMLDPLAIDGAAIVDQIQGAVQAGEFEITAAEALQLEELSSEQLAELSFVINNLNNPSVMDELFSYIHQNIDPDMPPILYEPGAYTRQDLVDCLTVAFGLAVISGLWGYIDGTYSLMTATTAFNIVRALVSRTLSWVGIAYAAYEYANCLHSKKK